MQVTSVVRQWNLLAVASAFVVFFTIGLVFALGPLLGIVGDSLLVVGLGIFLMVLALAVIIACLISVTIRAAVGPDGLVGGEIGGRWRLGWSEITQVWLVGYRNQTYLAALPAGSPAPIRTAWRSRRFGLPETARTVRVDPATVPAIVQAVQTHHGAPTEHRSV